MCGDLRPDPAKLIERLREDGTIPASGSVRVVHLDNADDLLRSLGIDKSQVIQLPAAAVPGRAEVEVEMVDVDVNLPGLVSWAARKNLALADLKITRGDKPQNPATGAAEVSST
ncbi:MAG: hypothetical protein AB1492_02565 [Bacillota bacterium]